MARKRDYIDEIIEKRTRHLRRADRHEQFIRRIYPLVKGFRFIKGLDPRNDFRREWLKYGAIGYVASVEGYFRFLFADLINAGKPYSDRAADFKEIRFAIDDVIAIHADRVSLGEYIAHLLPVRGIQDINYCMSTILGEDFLHAYRTLPLGSKPIDEVFPAVIGDVEALFQLRHLYCHELAPKAAVQPRKIKSCIGSTAIFTSFTEELIQSRFLK